MNRKRREPAMRNVLMTVLILWVSIGVSFTPITTAEQAGPDSGGPICDRQVTSGTPATGEPASNNWLCRKCRTLVQAADKPSSSYCPSGGHHQWNNLGRVGNTLYQCNRCNTTVASKDKPSSAYCPAGGLHQWNRLAN